MTCAYKSLGRDCCETHVNHRLVVVADESAAGRTSANEFANDNGNNIGPKRLERRPIP